MTTSLRNRNIAICEGVSMEVLLFLYGDEYRIAFIISVS
ncbi:MAG: hypothetical protein K0R93_999 [Anaerosolibacter sp.]|jgi:hypothetical protein|nr:hypothetical protein [Anaerosolibacter sp.]